ncbi:MAG: protease inhibitor I42 family protein [Sedimentisphaerales bacterium]|nr:protease inhibitor I42 family protein [Sedimentisphaerales bacterium]
MKYKWVLFCIELPFLIGCSQSKMVFSERLPVQPMIEICAGLGEEITLELPANPSTGYSWRLVGAMPFLLRPVARKYEPAQQSGSIIGAGGTEIWTFRADETGQADMTVEYARPWETDTPATLTRTFHIVIQ